MDNIKFSVIVPIYNISLYLKQCLDSIVNQNYANLEIILVDDGSTDDSGKICDAYAEKDSRILVLHKENGGLVSARKAGAKKASGDYVACVDGDDWIDAEYFEKFAEAIKQSNADILFCSYKVSTVDKEYSANSSLPLGYYDRRAIEEQLFPILIYGKGRFLPCMLWSKVFRSELYIGQQLEVNDKICIGEDAVCVIPCVYNAESVFVLDDALYHYRKNPTSITRNRKPFDWDGPKLRGEHLERKIDMTQTNFQVQLYQSIVNSLFNVAASQFNRTEKYKDIKKDIEMHLDEPYYKKAIDNCTFASYKGKLALWALKNHKIRFLKIYNKIKR